MNDAYIGLGSNLGAPVANLRSAVLALDELPNTEVVSVSHVYESEPWGVADQPPFANAVAWVRTPLRADQLLGYLKQIETDMGRRQGERFGPRVIDLDLLLHGDEEWDTQDLVVPHPRMIERDFVLTPLLSIASEISWPGGRAIRREGDLVGRVVADHGRLPDTDPDWYVWEANDAIADGTHMLAEPTPWDSEGEWVEVSQARAAGGQMDVVLSMLRAAEIPFELSHREFGDAMGIFAGPAKVLVPIERSEEARLVIARGPQSDTVLPGPPTELPGPESPPERPAWFTKTLKVFGWVFVIYWSARVLSGGSWW